MQPELPGGAGRCSGAAGGTANSAAVVVDDVLDFAAAGTIGLNTTSLWLAPHECAELARAFARLPLPLSLPLPLPFPSCPILPGHPP